MVRVRLDGSAGPLVAALLAEIEAVGFSVSTAENGYVVSSERSDLPLRPRLVMSEDLIEERLSVEAGNDSAARAEALSLMKLHLVEELTTDHLEGANYTSALGYRRNRRGRVEFFADQDRPPIPRPEPAADVEWRA